MEKYKRMSFAVRNKKYIQHFARGRSGVNVCCDRLTFVIETIKIVTISCYTDKYGFRAIPHKSAREAGERFFVRKRCKTADILCVFQGFMNAFLAEKIRKDPQTYLRGAAIYKAPLTEADALQKEIHYEQYTKQYGGNT